MLSGYTSVPPKGICNVVISVRHTVSFLIGIATLASVGLNVPLPLTARASGTGSGSVDNETISAEVRYDAPPRDSACVWEPVRGSTTLPIAGTQPTQYESLYYRACDDRIMSYHWIRDSTPQRIATSAHSKVSRLVNSLLLRTAPPSDKMVVTIGTWFWIPRAAWKPVSVTAWIPTHVGPISVTTTATPHTITYTPGDGRQPVTCKGPGTPWTARTGDRARSACMYTYTRASHGRRDRHFRAAMHVTWIVTWRSSLGLAGRLPNIRTGSAVNARVLELQALSR
jgi:hypothetical protein